MDKNAIKKYAVWARRELIEKVSQKALQYGIEEGLELDPNLESVNGVLLSDVEKKQRQALISKIQQDGYSQVIEEVAYTWFNRFIALRFMEVNGYLPSHVRVFTDENNQFKPQILAEALHLEFDNLDKEKVMEMSQARQDDDLYKYLLLSQCNELSVILPGMFPRIADYTELLLPDYLLREGSVIEQMVVSISEDDWTDQVQIIGWLYQYYNSDLKDEVFSRPKGRKMSKHDIPPVTQLFTPDWIVRYMVENSLGRLWLNSHSNSSIRENFKYYIENTAEDVYKTSDITPKDIKCIDPCMGSGHVLAYLFDVLISIYEDYGFAARDAAIEIVNNNLYGLDIDDRAGQLAYFTVMMKGRQYDRRFFSREIRHNILAINESDGISTEAISYFANTEELKKDVNELLVELHNAKEFGSMLMIKPKNWEAIENRLKEIEEEPSLFKNEILTRLTGVIKTGKILAQKYHVVITNPPYAAVNGFSKELFSYINANYKDGKSDLFAVFMERCKAFTLKDYYYAMITQQSWMFISSFENLRNKVLANDIVSIVEIGYNSFPELNSKFAVAAAFVVRMTNTENYVGAYLDLNTNYGKSYDKEKAFFEELKNPYYVNLDKLSVIPGHPIAFWLSDDFITAFSEKKIADYSTVITGMTTGNNNAFLRLWQEVDFTKIVLDESNMDNVDLSCEYWIPYSKGGERRNWYGNTDYLVNWKRHGEFNRSKTTLKHLYLKEAVTWPFINIDTFCARYLPQGYLWDVAGSPCFFSDKCKLKYTLGYLCSVVARSILPVINPSVNVQAVDIERLPLIISEEYYDEVVSLVTECIEIAKADWDSFENSWDFKKHPLAHGNRIEESFREWEKECDLRFNKIKENEERINDIFVDIYHLGGQVDTKLEDRLVTINKANVESDIKSLISYAVGCMFGRYSLDNDGVVFAGGEWDTSKYKTFLADDDGIIPICDDEYFSDDIVGKFVEFIETVYGDDTLEENLEYIAKALGGKGSSRQVIRDYFLNDFYGDHCNLYSVTGSGKRPIYWQFDSGKKNGFKCLVYIHRYSQDTVARIRTDYVHEQQARYRTACEELEKRLQTASDSEKVKISKRLNDIKAQDEELHLYEEKIHHFADQMISLNLDDGIKNNYEIFKDVLAKIK